MSVFINKRHTQTPCLFSICVGSKSNLTHSGQTVYGRGRACPCPGVVRACPRPGMVRGDPRPGAVQGGRSFNASVRAYWATHAVALENLSFCHNGENLSY